MKYKWIVMDMDGTLTNHEKKITPRTKEVLIKAQKQGATLILASGRPTHGLYKEAKELMMDTYGGILMSFNGARVIEYPSEKLLYNHVVLPKCKRPIINNARALNLSVMIHDGAYVITDVENCYKADYEASICHMEIKVVEDLNEYVETFDPNKFLISAPADYLKTQLEDFRLPFGDMLTICTSAPFYIEVVDNGIDKGSALAKLCEQMHVSKDEVIAFGDEMNDLTMLQYAGCGVAMGNAVKPIRLIADEITASNDEDGIAQTLEKYL